MWKGNFSFWFSLVSLLVGTGCWAWLEPALSRVGLCQAPWEQRTRKATSTQKKAEGFTSNSVAKRENRTLNSTRFGIGRAQLTSTSTLDSDWIFWNILDQDVSCYFLDSRKKINFQKFWYQSPSCYQQTSLASSPRGLLQKPMKTLASAELWAG